MKTLATHWRRLAKGAAAAALGLAATFASEPSAQAQGWQGGWQGGGPVQPQQPPGWTPARANNRAGDFELTALYVSAAAYGVGTGIWIDAETGLDDPGLAIIPPAVLGVGLPVGAFVYNRLEPMPRGMPGAIAAGLAIGGGAGFGIWSTQFVRADEADAWGFKEMSRSVFLGSTIGGGLGLALGYLQEPAPNTSLLLSSSAVWGGAIGSMFGYGASPADIGGFGGSNDYASLWGLIGYGVGLGAAGAASAVWVPTDMQLGYMWAGAGIGFVATLPVYLLYTASDSPTKRGLIVQGTGTALGLAAGYFLSFDDVNQFAENEAPKKKPLSAGITSFGYMPLNGGAGAQLSGWLF